MATCTYSCRSDDNPQEKITKLRAVGVSSTPAVASSGSAATSAELTFYAAVPLGKTVGYEAFIDPQAKYSLAELVVPIAASETYKDYLGFRLYSLKATLLVPALTSLRLQEGQSQRLRYGVRFFSEDEEEKVVGDVLVFPQEAEQTKWVAPSLEIAAPIDSVPHDSDSDLKATLTKSQNEKVKIGWFVSGGTVKNRRAVETQWSAPGPGNHTVIVTAHGSESRSFAISVKDVTVK